MICFGTKGQRILKCDAKIKLTQSMGQRYRRDGRLNTFGIAPQIRSTFSSSLPRQQALFVKTLTQHLTWLALFVVVLLSASLSLPSYADTGSNCAQHQQKLKEFQEITELAREQIADLQKSNLTKRELIAQYKVKVGLLEQRISILESTHAISEKQLNLLEQNQDICLTTEQQSYTLMKSIMTDYQKAVAKATRPWYQDPSFYGGLLLGLLAAI